MSGRPDILVRLAGVSKRSTADVGVSGDVFWDIVKEFGKTFNLRIMFTDIVYTIEPHQVKRVLATDFENFEKGERFCSLSHTRNLTDLNILSGERFIFALEGALGSGVFNSDGEMWK